MKQITYQKTKINKFTALMPKKKQVSLIDYLDVSLTGQE